MAESPKVAVDQKGLITELLERVPIAVNTISRDWSLEWSSEPFARLRLEVFVDSDLVTEIVNNHIIQPKEITE